jgi:4-hydroxybenzoate polyprenyltransferase
MKHRRFSFVTTVVMMLALVALIAIGGIWLKETLDLPDWVSPLITMVMMTASFEFAARFGPKEFDTPFSIFRQENRRDQIVVLVAVSVFIIIALPIGQGIFAQSDLAAYGCLILGAGAFYAICFIGGSRSLRAQFKPKQPSNHAPDESRQTDKS